MNFLNEYTIYSVGDHAVTIELSTAIDEETNEKVLCLFNHFMQQKPEEIKDIIPAYSSLTLVYDIIAVRKKYDISAHSAILQYIEKKLSSFTFCAASTKNCIVIPVCYDISLGIDLQEMAIAKSTSIPTLINLHLSKIYRVYMIGFLPGFAYLGKVDALLATHRRSEPRKKIEAGSVGIAGDQTGIYPVTSPGGWNIIGQTPIQLFNQQKPGNTLLKQGDLVRFEAIDIATFHQLKNKV